MPLLTIIAVGAFLCTIVICRKAISGFWNKLREALTPMEDQWTLTTLSGEVFEEVEIEELTATQVTFSHRVDKTCLPLALLTEESQQRLHEGLRKIHAAAVAEQENPSRVASVHVKPA